MINYFQCRHIHHKENEGEEKCYTNMGRNWAQAGGERLGSVPGLHLEAQAMAQQLVYRAGIKAHVQ